MFKASMTSRGQVAIPAELRRKLGLRPGCRFRLYESGSKVVLVPELQDPIASGLGFLRRPVDGAREELEDREPQEQRHGGG